MRKKTRKSRRTNKFGFTPEEQKRFDRELKKWEKRTQPLIDEIRESERITAEDLKIFITNKC